MAKEKEYKLAISLSEEFIKDKKINDLLYCWLLINSYYDIESQIRKIDKNKVNLSALEIELEITRKTLRSDLQYLININYIQLDNDNRCYIFKEINSRFISISQGLLTHMVLSNNKNIIKIYCILKSYYEMNKSNSFFTKTMLLDKIGYNKRTVSNYKNIDNILEWFVKNRYLNYDINGDNKQIKHKIEKIV